MKSTKKIAFIILLTMIFSLFMFNVMVSAQDEGNGISLIALILLILIAAIPVAAVIVTVIVIIILVSKKKGK